MPSIEEQLKNVRTMEDIVNLLSILFTNLNNQNEQYYDMFLNPVPMDLDLERYDENGELETVKHPNVAKMRITAYSGPGNPNGSQAASIGALYIDTLTSNVYYKATGSDSYGWQLVWTTNNLRASNESSAYTGIFLSPDGDGSQLQDLNANNVTSGVLKVTNGGTGVNGISGLIRGNGTAPFSEAVADGDYLSPSSFVGLIMMCPFAEGIPTGWLICDGTIYDASHEYWVNLQRLRRKLGNKYGGDGVNSFGVPNLVGKQVNPSTGEVTYNGMYIKCGVNPGYYESGHVGEHSHSVSGKTGDADQNHRHGPGDQKEGLHVWGNFALRTNPATDGTTTWDDGAFWHEWVNAPSLAGPIRQDTDTNVQYNVTRIWMDAYNGHGMYGNTGWMSHTHRHSFSATTPALNTGSNEVDHMEMIPIIKV